MLEAYLALYHAERVLPLGVHILGRFGEHFMHAVEAGEGFGQLAADVRDLEDRRDQESEVKRVSEKVADRHLIVHDQAPADDHHRGADDADQQRRGEDDQRGSGQSSPHVIEQSRHSAGERLCFARFGVKTFNDPDAAERLREASRHLGIDFAALTKNRAQRRKSLAQDDAEEREEPERQQSQTSVDIEQQD